VSTTRAVKALHAAGLNDRQIAARIGRHRVTVRYHRRLLRLPANAGRGRPRSPKR
jgi:transposase